MRPPQRKNPHRAELRGPLLASSVPRFRTRSQRFDELAVDAYAPVRAQFAEQLLGVDLAIDLAPRMRLSYPTPPDVVADGPVPLGRFIPAGVDHQGNPTRARIVVFRKPIERRAGNNLREQFALLQWVCSRLVAYVVNEDPGRLYRKTRSETRR
ncbi:MAG: metallopeptidase family protein [Corynebacterium sp.]|nr:metallopeptidase family protein [Corynebacterium sp.]